MLVLAMQFDQPKRQLSECGRRRERSVHEGPAAPLARDVAAHHDVATAVLEERLDRCLLLARPDQVARSAAAEQQPGGPVARRRALMVVRKRVPGAFERREVRLLNVRQYRRRYLRSEVP